MTKCQFCHRGLNSTYIRIGSSGSLKKIGSYCNDCNLHYNLEQKLYTVNEKLYTVYRDLKPNDYIAKIHSHTIITTNQSKFVKLITSVHTI